MTLPPSPSSSVRIVGDLRAQVGESAFWDRERQCLWWVDTFAPAILRTEPMSGETWRYPTPQLAGGVAIATGGGIIGAFEQGLYRWSAGAAAFEWLGAPEGMPATHRFNDLTVDPLGRLIVGSMKMSQKGPPEPTGILYRYDGQGWVELIAGLTTANGLAFSPSGDRIYWSDSAPAIQRIWTATYDAVAGTMGRAETFVDMSPYRGRPDGAAVDREGGYWIAAIGGACLHRFDTGGRLDRTIELPVEHPTKPAFGGADLDLLFVTSLSIVPGEARPELAGALLSVEAGVAGHPVPTLKDMTAQGGDRGND